MAVSVSSPDHQKCPNMASCLATEEVILFVWKSVLLMCKHITVKRPKYRAMYCVNIASSSLRKKEIVAISFGENLFEALSEE